MKIVKASIAGTLESSDAQVRVEPSDRGLELSIVSVVMNQYGRQIQSTIKGTLERLGVESGKVSVIDHGALDCTLIARIECAVYRSSDTSNKDIPWGVL